MCVMTANIMVIYLSFLTRYHHLLLYETTMRILALKHDIILAPISKTCKL